MKIQSTINIKNIVQSVSFISDSIKYLPVDSDTQSCLYSVRYDSSLDYYYPSDHRQTNNMKDNNKFIKSV